MASRKVSSKNLIMNFQYCNTSKKQRYKIEEVMVIYNTLDNSSSKKYEGNINNENAFKLNRNLSFSEQEVDEEKGDLDETMIFDDSKQILPLSIFTDRFGNFLIPVDSSNYTQMKKDLSSSLNPDAKFLKRIKKKAKLINKVVKMNGIIPIIEVDSKLEQTSEI